ncbi:response regulator [Pseudanabaena sp. FACHB-1277]|uniref:Response regulator n=1 Tax=Pseudanabaena cinerea FACHB-1277 TaxID=2949581 RepID=A0A926UTQ9_9CYAN|nr:response regulator [Pseudanabaena cinerea]MBD2151185.1 response regulator [Pseudanabaena cinerea FACHB-1277]
MNSPNIPHPPLQLKILLAEDNPINQKVATRILSHLGHQADVVANGREAIIAIANKFYDLILMDIQMPEMDGLMAAQHIRQLEVTSHSAPITIIAMTANATDEDRELCRKAGMDDYLTKPIQIDKLKAILQSFSPRTT